MPALTILAIVAAVVALAFILAVAFGYGMRVGAQRDTAYYLGHADGYRQRILDVQAKGGSRNAADELHVV